MSAFTEAQQRAIRVRGNVLVSAGAGTGKTRTLVERCLRLVIEEGCSLENILMVTFTEAAAAEMRARLRVELEKWRDQLRDESAGGTPDSARGLRSVVESGRPMPGALPATSAQQPTQLGFDFSPVATTGPALTRKEQGHSANHPESARALRQRLDWAEEQLALLDTASISTLHSFCLRLVREHFCEIHIDPQVTVLDDSQTQPLIHDAFDMLLDACYRDELPFAAAARELVRLYGGGTDYRIRALVLKLHRYIQSLPPARRWLESEIASLQNPEPIRWRAWLIEAFCEWRAEWMPELRHYTASENVAECLRVLESCAARPTFDEVASALERIQNADAANWFGKKGKFRQPIKQFFTGAAFLASLTERRDKGDPLADDWASIRGPMLALLELTREFTTRFTAAKRALGGVDFADLEQLALALLIDGDGRATGIAEDWQRRWSHVFVDEYQDINAAQDAILCAVSRGVRNSGEDATRASKTDGAEWKSEPDRSFSVPSVSGNRFLVGDVKQSIYRFRLADPTIFRRYENDWRDGLVGQRIPLSDNFRSREAILEFINPLFAALMRSSIGGVSFDLDAQLRFGAPAERVLLGTVSDGPRVELHVITKAGASDSEQSEEDTEEAYPAARTAAAWSPVEDLLAVEREARLIALQLRKLHANGHQIWNEREKRMQAVEWRDMVVLLRSPRPRVESFAQEFSHAGVPLSATRPGFYCTIEVLDLLNLLKVLDNPLQDIPLIAVLRSPLVGLSLEELASVRILGGDGSFFAAIHRTYLKASVADDVPTARVRARLRTFLANFERWRQLARQTSVSQCLETVLAETHYEAMLLAQPRGRERKANVHRLLELARRYDPYRRQGLYRFLQFVAAQEDAGLDVDSNVVETENAVRLMSIHQSKGLEFPVVALGCLGAAFNFQDLREEILLHAQLGLCPKIIASESGQPYPSLPFWMAKQREQRERLGEEMRLLYVAMTRARDTLLLTAFDRTRNSGTWESDRATPLSDRELISAQNYFAWLKLWLTTATTAADWKNDAEGECRLLRWSLHREDEFGGGVPARIGTLSNLPVEKPQPATSDKSTDLLHRRLAWRYQNRAATTEPAKASVSVLRRQIAEENEESQTLFRAIRSARRRKSVLSAAEIGLAHHTFLQRVEFDRVGTVIDLRNESERLLRSQHLAPEETAALNFEALLNFWQSPIGRSVRDNATHAHRELPFTARFTVAELHELGLSSAEIAPQEFVVVQGVIDLALILPNEVQIIDFKTDLIERGQLPQAAEKYRPQLRLYASALSRIYNRPVSEKWLHFLSVGETVPV